MTTRAELSAAEAYGHGDTPLMRAALDGNTESVRELINQGADINRRDDSGRTALMFAVVNRHYETMKLLLEHGADVNARSKQGGTALMGAAMAAAPTRSAVPFRRMRWAMVATVSEWVAE